MKKQFHSIHGNIFTTPDWLFDSLNKEFDFQWDLACEKNNSKCNQMLNSEKYDSLKVDWHKLCDGWLWINPPYSPLKPWIVKAQQENKKGAKIVVLSPPILSTDGVEMKSNTGDSCLLVFDTKIRQPNIVYVKRDEIKKSINYE